MTSDEPAPPAPLQFETAIPAGTQPAAAPCGACKRPVGDTYYTAGKAVVCASCKGAIEQAAPTTPTRALVGRAVLFGLGGAILGALLYYAVLYATGYHLALVAIASAFIVGRAVQIGAREQRGRAFQIVAVVLAYLAIAAGRTEPTGLSADLLVAPVIRTFSNLPMSLVTGIIIGVGLLQAWRMNQLAPRLTFQGPFRVEAAPQA